MTGGTPTHGPAGTTRNPNRYSKHPDIGLDHRSSHCKPIAENHNTLRPARSHTNQDEEYKV
jgi:hypothetical protein